MIRARTLSCGYSASRPVLHGVDLRVGRGELVGLCGPNGAGKSTLIAALAGLLPPAEGRVELAGLDISGLSPRQRARLVSCAPQRLEAPAGFTVRELVLMGRFAHAGTLAGYGPEDHDAAENALREAGATELAGRMAAELSGGELQRVLLARALAQGKSVLLLDEATSAMDLARRVASFDLLARLAGEGSAILAAMHDINLAALYCPRLVFLKAGRVVLDGPTREIFTETNLKDIYETDLRVAAHPVTGAPQAHLVPGAAVHLLG